MTAPASDFDVFRAAREPVAPAVRSRVGRDASALAVMVMLDAVAGVTGATTDALRTILRECPGAVSVWLEDVDARDAHAVVNGLAGVGLLDVDNARIAHCRIDRRSTATGRRPIL